VGRHVIDESVNKRIKFLVCMRYKVGHISLNLLISDTYTTYSGR
jgi:hypothetical protein